MTVCLYFGIINYWNWVEFPDHMSSTPNLSARYTTATDYTVHLHFDTNQCAVIWFVLVNPGNFLFFDQRIHPPVCLIVYLQSCFISFKKQHNLFYNKCGVSFWNMHFLVQLDHLILLKARHDELIHDTITLHNHEKTVSFL